MLQFATTLDNIAKTSSRKSKSTLLQSYLTTLSTPDLITVSRILLDEYTTNVGSSTIASINETQSSLFPSSITLKQVWQLIMQLTYSSNTNVMLINDLIGNASPIEKRYLKKILTNNINVGISTNTTLDVLAKTTNNPSLKSNYMICSDISTHLLNTFNGPRIFTPIKPMLAKVQEIEEPHLIQLKLDGLRFHYHKQGNIWAIYSRRCEDISKKHQQLGEQITEYLSGVDSIILDGELVTADMICQDAMRKDAELYPRFFDILYINNQSLIDKPLVERLQHLKDINLPMDYYVTSFHNYTIDDAFNYAMDHQYEGLVIKNLNETYIPNERKWAKIKKGTDTIDLVITGYEPGEGRREDTIGSLICSIYHDDTLHEFCKVGSGLKDADINHLMTILTPTNSSNGKITVEPRHVIELKYFEISRSPKYDLGYSLRFPIYIKLRPDKSISDSTTFDQLQLPN